MADVPKITTDKTGARTDWINVVILVKVFIKNQVNENEWEQGTTMSRKDKNSFDTIVRSKTCTGR